MEYAVIHYTVLYHSTLLHYTTLYYTTIPPPASSPILRYDVPYLQHVPANVPPMGEKEGLWHLSNTRNFLVVIALSVISINVDDNVNVC